MIIDTEQLRTGIEKMKDKVKSKSADLTYEVYNSHMITLLTLDGILDFIEESKDIRPTGKWIFDKHYGEYRCSECNRNPISEGESLYATKIEDYRYCRWCGALMINHDTIDEVADE